MRSEQEIRMILKDRIERAIRRFSAAESSANQELYQALLQELDSAVHEYTNFTRNGTIPANLRD